MKVADSVFHHSMGSTPGKLIGQGLGKGSAEGRAGIREVYCLEMICADFQAGAKLGESQQWNNPSEVE
jgi:hypothetical protein